MDLLDENMGSLDVVEILKVGLPGLVFLLSLLAYKLLAGVEATENPNQNVLKLIKCYMYINVALAVLTMASPIIDYALSEKSQIFIISAVAASSDQEGGTASVCIDEKYLNRYLLVRDLKTQKLIQVFAKGVIPCTSDKHIVLSPVDIVTLGWQPSTVSADVEVVTALPGFMFVSESGG